MKAVVEKELLEMEDLCKGESTFYSIRSKSCSKGLIRTLVLEYAWFAWMMMMMMKNGHVRPVLERRGARMLQDAIHSRYRSNEWG